MKFKTQIMDEVAVGKALTRISYEIIEKTDDLSNVILVGVKTRGIPLADVLGQNIAHLAGVTLPVYKLDVSSYRDDLNERRSTSCPLDFNPTGKEVVLVDDVLFTGRTTRACMDAILENGRAKSIRLAVLMDRGHRELPIRADFVGKNVPTSQKEKVVVRLKPYDDETSVSIFEKE